jgi:hypothetical protein
VGQIDIVAVEQFHSLSQLQSQIGAGEVAGDLLGNVGVGVAVDAGFGGEFQRVGAVGSESVELFHALFGGGIGGKNLEAHAGNGVLGKVPVVEGDIGVGVVATAESQQESYNGEKHNDALDGWLLFLPILYPCKAIFIKLNPISTESRRLK